ncbi:hypothetical protein LMG7141_00818 [Ralstonia condita]|uniref:Uncharacterized protein n=1 Tax=Ralstonia condita TaxID=3058600 RepID=A0ABM9J152_9RALS|nr:hypothetical protein [Ralstonia sp. LMG 7141]CAJ0778928.1 hypothetical protein LMG7141_00818 [Ralstonia sp. LMG 7141]
MSLQPTYQGEVQFAGYSDSSRSGPRVTMRLHDRDDLQLFVGKEGKRFALVLVEIGDDEQPVQPAPEAPKGGALAKLAGMWCQEPEFWAFLNAWRGDTTYPVVVEPGGAALAVRAICGVDSRAALDHDKIGETRFQTLIRIPYMRWMAGDRS